MTDKAVGIPKKQEDIVKIDAAEVSSSNRRLFCKGDNDYYAAVNCQMHALQQKMLSTS